MGALFALHVRPTIPVSFLLVLLLVMPWGYLLTVIGAAIAAVRLPNPVKSAAGVLVGLAYVWGFGSGATAFMAVNVTSIGLALAALITRPPGTAAVRRVAIAVFTLFVGFLAIW